MYGMFLRVIALIEELFCIAGAYRSQPAGCKLSKLKNGFVLYKPLDSCARVSLSEYAHDRGNIDIH